MVCSTSEHSSARWWTPRAVDGGRAAGSCRYDGAQALPLRRRRLQVDGHRPRSHAGVGSQHVGPGRLRQPGHGPLRLRHRVGHALGVGPVAAQHERVLAHLGDQTVRHLVGQRGHPHLAQEVVGRAVRQLVEGLPVALGVEVRRPVDVQEEVRHPAGRQLDDADAQAREALEHPGEDQVGQGDRRRQVQEDRVEELLAVLVLPGPPGRVQRALELRDVEDRRHALVAEGGPHRVEVRVRERLPVHRRRGDHGQAHALRPHPPDLLHGPGRVMQEDVGHPEEPALRHRCTRRPRSGCRPVRWPAARRGPTPAAVPTAGRSSGTRPRRRARRRRATRARAPARR